WRGRRGDAGEEIHAAGGRGSRFHQRTLTVSRRQEAGKKIKNPCRARVGLGRGFYQFNLVVCWPTIGRSYKSATSHLSRLLSGETGGTPILRASSRPRLPLFLRILPIERVELVFGVVPQAVQPLPLDRVARVLQHFPLVLVELVVWEGKHRHLSTLQRI